MRKALLFLVFLLALNLAFSATITGEVVEWDTFETLDNVIVEIDTVPSQRDVTTNGEYSFEVGPGEYVISAEYYEGDTLVYSDSQELVVSQEGNFVVDLLMFPALDDIEEDIESVDFNDIGEVAIGSEVTGEEDYSWIVGLGLTVFVLILAAIILFLLWKSDVLSHAKKDEEDSLDDFAEEVLALLRKRGNRMTQKEIRDEIKGIGEAKISLIISELESMGKIKKIKKGRGNIIVLKK